ncbi:MAG: PucR family transcriptional regulator [Lawsonibacter sp.]
MAFTVQDLITRNVFPGLKLLAGKKGEKNEIRWVNIMEIMDSPESISPNELLFTTGYGFEDANLYRRLIPQLVQYRVSGIVVQTGYYIDSIPSYILTQADKLGFPVLSMPKNVTFSEILHTMIQVITPDHQCGWDKITMQQAHMFLEQTLKGRSQELFPNCTEKGHAVQENQHVQLMLLEPVNYICTDENKWRDCLTHIRSYIQSHSSIYCVQELPQYKFIFLVTNSDQNCLSMIYELGIKFTLLSERLGTNCYMGTKTIGFSEDAELSLQHVVDAINTLRFIGARRGVCDYDNINFIKMVGRMHQNDYSAVLDNHPLQVLLNYDRSNETNYVQTLRVYLSNSCNVTQTAKQLFVHRHTLLKRLDKIELIGGLDLKDYYTRIYMSINLMFHDYFVY